MRKKIIAGNWKMNLKKEDAFTLVDNIVAGYQRLGLSENKIMLLAPSFVYLNFAQEKIENKEHLYIAAQDCSVHNSGAYTGEVSAMMLQSIGISYCIIGHSERRQYHNEDAEILYLKIKQAIANQIIPIFCCGEDLETRTQEQYFDFIKRQLETCIFKLEEEDFNKIIIAYEPIWAIGTGKTATVAQAEEMHAYIRKLIEEKYNKQIAHNTSILYGGSVNASNAKNLFLAQDIDGALVGGASLKYEDFVQIAEAL